MQKLMGLVRRCVDDYHMIEAGDRIGVGVSGGKDSLALLMLMAELRRHCGIDFYLEAVTVDLGFGMDFKIFFKTSIFLSSSDKPTGVVSSGMLGVERSKFFCSKPNSCSFSSRALISSPIAFT